MASNVLGLCVLVLGAAGITNSVSFQWGEKMENPDILQERRWSDDRRSDMYSHFKHRQWNYEKYPFLQPYRKFEPLDYKISFKKLFATRNPLILPKVKYQDDLSRLKITTTYATENNENNILTSDTYDEVPENLIGCNDNGCIEKSDGVSSRTVKNETEDENNFRLDPSSSSILPSTSESSSPQRTSESANSSESNENTTLTSDTSPTLENITNEASNSNSSPFNTESTISPTAKTSGEEDLTVSSVTITSTQTLDNSTNEDTSDNITASNNGTTVPSETSENSTNDDGSEDSSVSYSTTVSFENRTDEVTAASHTTATEVESSTDIPSTATEENLTANPETSSDVSVPSTTVPDKKETSESRIPSETELISSTEAQLTSSQSPEEKSTASDSFTSTPDKDLSVSSTSVNVEKTTVDISSTLSSEDPTSSKSKITTETAPLDHNIKISSVRTARLIVTVVFLVILLIAVTILAVYVFKAKRRAVEYDQLTLLP